MLRYRFENMVPQWGTLNNGNWRSVESTINQKMDGEQEGNRIIIVTGSHEVCKLASDRNRFRYFYLANGKIPVPKYIWKLYFNLNTQDGIVYISLNNPYEVISKSVYLCENICVNEFQDYDLGGSSSSSSSPTRDRNSGYIYCCTFQNFINAYGPLHYAVFQPFQ